MSELLSEVADGKESVQRYKANSDSYQRRNEKLQGLLETSRKEVEDLQVRWTLRWIYGWICGVWICGVWIYGWSDSLALVVHLQ